MIKFTLLGLAAILSTAIVTPVPAQAIVQEPSAYAFFHPGEGLRLGSTPSQRGEVGEVGRETADATASAPPARSWLAANETTTRPWSAAGRSPPAACN